MLRWRAIELSPGQLAEVVFQRLRGRLAHPRHGGQVVDAGGADARPASRRLSAAPGAAWGRCPAPCPAAMTTPVLLRRLRWKVMAKRCASSRMRCTRKRPSELSRQQDRDALAGQENLLALLGQPDHRHLIQQIELLQHLDRHAELALAAVHDQQVGQHRPLGDAARAALLPGSPSCGSTARRKRRRSTSRIDAKSSGSPCAPGRGS